jgi:hypothetical protein
VQPTEFIRGFLNDLRHLPLIFQLGLLAIVANWAWQRHKGRKRKELERAAASWPQHRARVVWAQVSDERREGRHGPAYWEGILTYSYAFPGQELEVGEHRQRFYDEAVAADWARGLKDSFVIVRVDPANPKSSVWLDEGGSTAAALAAVTAERALGEERWRGTGHMVVAGAVFAVAGTAALAALCIVVSCLKGKPIITAENNTGAFFGMHVGLIVCLIAAQALSTPGSSQDLTKWFQTTANSLKNSGVVKWLGACYAVLFVYAWIRIAAKDGDAGFWSILMFSGGWFVGYLSAAGMCWRVLTRTQEETTVS